MPRQTGHFVHRNDWSRSYAKVSQGGLFIRAIWTCTSPNASTYLIIRWEISSSWTIIAPKYRPTVIIESLLWLLRLAMLIQFMKRTIKKGHHKVTWFGLHKDLCPFGGFLFCFLDKAKPIVRWGRKAMNLRKRSGAFVSVWLQYYESIRQPGCLFHKVNPAVFVLGYLTVSFSSEGESYEK